MRADHPPVEYLDSRSFYASSKWRLLRYNHLLKPNNQRCALCLRGRKDGVSLHVDHIKPRSLYPHLELNELNLQTLCADCNLGKSNRDSIDWRGKGVASRS